MDLIITKMQSNLIKNLVTIETMYQNLRYKDY